jgi:multimeric flavodoxin WrbA
MNVKILGIVGSPRANSNTEVMIREALKGAEEISGIETELLLLAGKKVLPCSSCYKCVERKELCIFRHKDFMGEFYEKWLMADGVIIGSPVYHLSITGILKNAIDRLGEGIFALSMTQTIKNRWFCKIGGVITQGMAAYGGQELTLQFLVNHLLVLNNLVVPPEAITVPGVAGSFKGNKILEPGVIAQYDPDCLKHSQAMGRRVAEIAKIFRAGVEALQNDLPAEYQDYVLTKEGYRKILQAGAETRNR